MLELLVNATSPDENSSYTRYPCGDESHVDKVVSVFSRITGPYAFVYYDACNAQIFYGRDNLGRRSLLVNKHRRESFAISSVCDPDTAQEWEEVEPDSIYVLDLCAERDMFQNSTQKEQCNGDLGPVTYTYSELLSIIPKVKPS